MLMYVIVILTILIIRHFKIQYAYWKNKNVLYIPPRMPFGNFQNFLTMKKSFGGQIKDMYDHFRSLNAKHAGFYHLDKPVYMPIDLEIIKNITTTDFNYFNEKPTYTNKRDQPMSINLFNMGGDEWRDMRHKMTPTFTPVKLKTMLDTLLPCCYPLVEALTVLAEKGEPIVAKEIASKFTIDVICAAAYGIDCNSFKDPAAQFLKHGKAMVDMTLLTQIKIMVATAFRDWANKLHIINFPTAIETFFTSAINDTMLFREEQIIKKNDFMQFLINIKNKGTVDSDTEAFRKLTVDEVVGQAFIVFLAGSETPATAISFCLYELALNTEIQDRVRKEINDVLEKYDGKITYESLLEMKYMKQVINESLRKYPPLTTIERRCNRTYQVPNTDVILEQGSSVVISLLGLQRDPEYFPDPDKFDPDRFSPENIPKILSYSYMPFGDGPKSCIGRRFGIMQSQVGLITFLQHFKYTINKSMTPTNDLSLAFIITLKEKIVLDVTKIN